LSFVVLSQKRFKMKKFFFLLSFILLFSCQENKITKTSEPEIVEASVAIGGMTCQIGCANLIESKMIKTEGVTGVQVVFEDSIGTIQYDKNKISEKQLIEVIENIAGGDLYYVKTISSTSTTPLVP